MLRNYLKIALRTLWRNKFHAAINVTGLAIGVSACLVIYLIVNFELSFNKGIADYDRIYRIHSKFTGTFSGLNRGAPTAVAPYVKDNFKGVENVTLFFCYGSKLEVPTATETKKFDRQKTVALAGPDYFQVFNSYEWIVGSPEVLTKPHQVVLVESQAKKYFGEVNVETLLGKEIIYRDSLVTHVAGILRDLPFNTDLEFTDFISTATIEASWIKRNFQLNDWASTNSSTQVFVKAAPGTKQTVLEEQLPQLSKNYAEKSSWDAVNTFNVQPLSELHYNPETGIFDNSREPAHMPTLLTLIGVAVLLLVIGAINFINLETAQAVRRAKEVGVRKVLGSTRTRLVFQFLCEGLLLTLVAIVLALPLAEFSLSYFSEFIPEGVSFNIIEFIPFLIFVVLFIGILASAYPAFVLSSFLPALALKNQAHISSSQSSPVFLRKALIVFQFTFAQVLIIGTLMVGWQIRFLLNKDLGFKKDAVVYFDAPWWEESEKTALLKNEIESIAEITDFSLSEAPPSYNGWSSSSVKYNNGKEDVSINAFRKFGDSNYLNFYGITLLAGRNLEPSDTAREFIINETLLKQLGFTSPQQALGEVIDYSDRKLPIVGVVKDFHIQSLHNKVEPVMMANALNDFSCFNLRLATAHTSGDNLKASLDKIENAWKKIYPDVPFKYQFLDDTIKNFYKTEQRTSKMARTAMGLAIFISCLGLFGLASYSATQRTKEIGIRKVLGASVKQIVFLLSKDFILLVVIAFVLAAPLAWMGVNRWLEGFSYRTELSAWMFVATGLLAVLVAFITVSYQTFYAANRNPTESLRSE